MNDGEMKDLCRKANLPRYMYDTPDAREALTRLVLLWPRLEARTSASDQAELVYWRNCNADILHRKDAVDGLSHAERIAVIRMKVRV